MELIDTSSKKVKTSDFKVPDIPTKVKGNANNNNLEDMFERMEIKVVGRENED
jgi:hypothetical protein